MALGLGASSRVALKRAHDNALTLTVTTQGDELVRALGEPDGPLSEEECREFAGRFRESVLSGDAERINGLIDWDALLEVSVVGMDVPQSVRDGVLRGLTATNQATGGMFRQIRGQVGKYGSYDPTRIYESEGESHVLFLRVAHDGGVTYHDLILRRRPDGEIRVVDYINAVTAEPLSKTFRRTVLSAVIEARRREGTPLTSSDEAELKLAEGIENIEEALAEGDPKRALQIYENLPEGVKKDKTLLVFRLNAARALDDNAERIAAYEAFRSYYPEDLCTALLSKQYYLLTKDFDAALSAVDVQEKVTGRHWTHDGGRCQILTEKGDFAAARRYGRQALKMEPAYHAYKYLTMAALKDQAFDEVLELLTATDAAFSPDWADFSKLPWFADFVRSPQHQRWLEYQRARH